MRILLACLLLVGTLMASMAACLFLDAWWALGGHLDTNLGWGSLATISAIGCLTLALHGVRNIPDPPEPPEPPESPDLG